MAVSFLFFLQNYIAADGRKVEQRSRFYDDITGLDLRLALDPDAAFPVLGQIRAWWEKKLTNTRKLYWSFFAEGYLTSCTFDYLTNTMDTKLFVFFIFVFSYCVPMFSIIFFYSQIVGHVVNHEKALKAQVRLFFN